MKKNALVTGLIAGLLFFSVPGFIDAEELIPPSRTLEAAEPVPGEVSLFSEPPGLEVFINEKSAGLTPARRVSLKPGTHSLQIEGSDFQFEIAAGQRFQISFFNGQFIKKPTPEPPPVGKKQAIHEVTEEPAAESRPRSATAPPTRQKKTKSGLSSWDLFINGSSRHF